LQYEADAVGTIAVDGTEVHTELDVERLCEINLIAIPHGAILEIGFRRKAVAVLTEECRIAVEEIRLRAGSTNRHAQRKTKESVFDTRNHEPNIGNDACRDARRCVLGPRVCL
jgi:hypothetical protein